MTAHGANAGLRVDGSRLLRRIEQLARIGRTDSGGSCRLALTDEDRDGRDLVVTWMRDLGMEVRVDGIGNVVATRAGRVGGPPVMCGSHIDTVRDGGHFDGALGVLAGLEVVETLATADVVTDRPLAVAFFTDEEGSRFAPDMLGSLVYVGGLDVESALEITGVDGQAVGDELARIGYLGSGPCPGPTPHAFIELHIEQGPVLEERGVTIGAVTGVQGISWQRLSLRGQANHAGTTPIRMRRDAGLVATQISVAVRDLAVRMGGDQVGTVGRIELRPNLVNVVAAEATLTVDLRNTDDDALVAAEDALAAEVERLAAAEGVEADWDRLARFEPVDFDGEMLSLIEDVAETLGHSATRLPSGAGHDAQMLARICPSGMIFVPSRDGVSHNPAEHTDPDQVTAGADVLLHALLRLATIDEVS